MNLLYLLFTFAVLFCLYLWLIAPRLYNRPDFAPVMRQPMYAHRGLHNNKSGIPENSLAAFSRAIQHGYGIELDVHLTKDNIPVVFHDDTLLRMCGTAGRLKDYTFEELKRLRLLDTTQTIPSLREVLELTDGKVPLIVELKAEGNSKLLCETVNRSLSAYRGVYCIESFFPQVLYWYRRNRPDIIRGQLSTDFIKENGSCIAHVLLTCLLSNFFSRPDFIAYNHKFAQNLSLRLCVKLFHALPAAWTVRTEEELNQARQFFKLFIFEKESIT